MKEFLISLIFLFLALPLRVQAQLEERTENAEQEAENAEIVGGLMFHHIPMQGTIDQFGEKLKRHFTLKRMMGAERNWIFQGFIYGKECPFQVFYTKKSRKVFRITVMPKNLDHNVWVDSLTNDYGEPVYTELGYVWQRPEGTVLLRVLEGYDPALIFLDRAGQAANKEEEKKRK